MYSIFLGLHNLNRWIILAVGIYVVVRAYQGWLGKQAWKKEDQRANLVFTIAMDMQLVIGLILYIFLSPLTKAAFGNFGAAMAETTLRFFAVEHTLIMIIALIAAHIGYAGIKRYDQSGSRYRNLAVFYSLAMILIILGTPWFRSLIPFIGN